MRSATLTPITVRLEIAKQTEQIDVEAGSGGRVEPTETQLGDSLSQQQVEAVPVNGRSFTDLLALTPGSGSGEYGAAKRGGDEWRCEYAFRRAIWISARSQ